jgi:hypothetical protein
MSKIKGTAVRKGKTLALIIAISILVIGLLIGNSLAYAYITITSPIEGQQLSVGSTFNIKGTSTAANGTNHCAVSVIINGIRPYQKAIPTETNGTKDYTSWQFTGYSGYAKVKLGQNKITGKYSCFPSTDTNNTQPTFVKYHSVNVTGIGGQQQNKSPAPASKGVPGILTAH